ncbi:hypothetical protein [Bosea sp. (in: a-proteobacteria)]|uniref:hypothetical protein n=1 Tax=Bosea sp. (in: a-proteobacteria) TaxID=1871050 RepID=UPI00122BF484|nr:hypothetical protein [Bosea sp. (in: a-proteobacteria)]TAJ27642.1 MAG: hypothetical protein EPO59_21120 [Bosea sp. (in: a-proteobacteria)]
MPMPSLSRWTMSYFAAALGCLLAAEGLAVLGIGYPAAGMSEPATLMLVHLVAIGWLSLAMAGALLQFVPVLAARPLASPYLALPTLMSLVAGLLLLCAGFATLAGWADVPLGLLPLGGLSLLGGLLLLVVMLGRTLAGLRRLDPFAGIIRGGLACLALTALGGAAFSTILSGRGGALGAFGTLLPGGLPFHALLGFGGWLGLIAFGVSYRLFAMFMIAPEPSGGRMNLLVTAAGMGLVLAAAGLGAPTVGLDGGSGLAATVSLLLALATGFYGRDMLTLYRSRRRKALEINMLASLPAFAALGFGIGALPIALIAGAGEGFVAAASFLLVFGWLGGLTLAQLTKIVPFLTWLEAYAPRIGKGPAPRVGELLAARRPLVWFTLYYGGTVLGSGALACGAPLGFRLAMTLALAGTAGIAAEFVRVRRLSQVKAADRPPPHERPRLLLARADERSLSHDDPPRTQPHIRHARSPRC